VTAIERRPRGRPKDLDKRAAIIASARALFFERGLEAVRVEEIAAAAGVSKMTVYANFPDKAALFEAVMGLQGAQMEEAFGHIKIGAGPIDQILVRVGNALLTFLLSPEIMRFDEILSAEMGRHPGLGQRFYAAGPNRIWKMLAAMIEGAAQRGEVRTTDPHRAAEDLIALWLGMVPLRHRFDELEPMSEAEITDRVDHGVAIFMKAHDKGAS
jgi:TetR/AcrR family transcriptional regulator, mexJK operon transcriptional repressor